MLVTLEDFIEKYTQIKQKGWIQTHRSGPTGSGKTLEDLLGIAENNFNEPDFGDYELKSCRLHTQSMLTMFTKSPQPARANTYLRLKYGYSSSAYDNQEKVLHATLTAAHFVSIANTGHSLKIVCDESKIAIASELGVENVFWDKQSLQKAFEKKYKNKFVYAKAESRGIGANEEFWFKEAYEVAGLSLCWNNVKSLLIFELGNILMAELMTTGQHLEFAKKINRFYSKIFAALFNRNCCKDLAQRFCSSCFYFLRKTIMCSFVMVAEVTLT